MPTYTYQCQKCDASTLVYHSMSAAPEVKCSACGSSRVKRMLGSGAGIIFKGSGFYETDYKTKSGGDGKGDSAGKAETKSESKGDSGGESKSSTKSESKSTTKSKAAKSSKKD